MITMRNRKTEKTIEVPVRHAYEVLIPQGEWEPSDEEIATALTLDTIDDSGESKVKEDTLEFCTKKELCRILTDKKINHSPQEKKVELLEKVKKVYGFVY